MLNSHQKNVKSKSRRYFITCTRKAIIFLKKTDNNKYCKDVEKLEP